MSLKSLFSFARGSIGIWSELRKIRQLFEWYLDHSDIGLPPSARSAREAVNDKAEHGELDEEQLADAAVQQLLKDLAEGKEVDTKWRPW